MEKAKNSCSQTWPWCDLLAALFRSGVQILDSVHAARLVWCSMLWKQNKYREETRDPRYKGKEGTTLEVLKVDGARRIPGYLCMRRIKIRTGQSDSAKCPRDWIPRVHLQVVRRLVHLAESSWDPLLLANGFAVHRGSHAVVHQTGSQLESRTSENLSLHRPFGSMTAINLSRIKNRSGCLETRGHGILHSFLTLLRL